MREKIREGVAQVLEVRLVELEIVELDLERGVVTAWILLGIEFLGIVGGDFLLCGRRLDLEELELGMGASDVAASANRWSS